MNLVQRVLLNACILLLPLVSMAETGMCLVVDQGQKGYGIAGKIYRIDLENDSIVNTTPALAAKGFFPRFSPDGEMFAYISQNKDEVVVCKIDGTELRRFAADGVNVSWTNGGIWVHREKTALFVKHDAVTGAVLRTVNVGTSDVGWGFVSQNEATIGMRLMNGAEGWGVGIVKLDQNEQISWFSSGCSVGPSPDGSMVTNNLWESGMEHQTMKVWSRDGVELHYYKLWEILGYPRDGYSWNDQCWSGNSNDIIILPAGKRGPDKFQQYGSTVPWIYNIRTSQAICLHANKDANVFWFPYDYYSGKIPVRESPRATAIQIEPENVYVAPRGTQTFSAVMLDQYGNPLQEQPAFQWAIDGGGTVSAGVFSADSLLGGPFTLSATAQGISGLATVAVSDIVYRVNCGSNKFDVPGWERDDGYIVDWDASNDYDWNGVIATADVADAAADDVYQSVYHLDHSYNFPDLANGTYILRLHMADLAYNTGRSMKYTAEGKTIVENLSVAEIAGAATAYVLDVPITVSDGNGLQIDCRAGTGNDVFECGLEILRTSDQTELPELKILSPSAGQTYHQGDTIDIEWYADPVKLSGATFALQVSIHDGPWLSIVQKTIGVAADGTGIYRWVVPQSLPISDSVIIRVEEYNGPHFDETEYFFLKAPSGVRASRLSGQKSTPSIVFSASGVHVTSDESAVIEITDMRGRVIIRQSLVARETFFLPVSGEIASELLLVRVMGMHGTTVSARTMLCQ